MDLLISLFITSLLVAVVSMLNGLFQSGFMLYLEWKKSKEISLPQTLQEANMELLNLASTLKEENIMEFDDKYWETMV